MEVERINTAIKNFKNPEILSLKYDLKDLTIEYSFNEHDDYLITFNNPVGFKCLDERDLSNYWVSKIITENTILRILKGGWLDDEIKAGRFISHLMIDTNEYLIRGINECIVVLSSQEPGIRKIATSNSYKQ